MPIEVHLHRDRPIPARLVRALYQAEEWWPERSEADIARVLDLAPAVGAWAGEDLIGFARLVTDGVFHAYVEDVVVRPDYRGQGIAKGLIRQLLEQGTTNELATLFCKERLVPLYEGLGFQPTKQVVLHRRR